MAGHRGARRRRIDYLIERMIPGDVFHVDAIVSERAGRLRRGAPLPQAALRAVTQGGGIFTTRTVERGSAVEKPILETLGQGRRAPRPRARRDAHRVHRRQGRRRGLLPRDGGARRRRPHRRPRRGLDRGQPLARVGEDRAAAGRDAVRACPTPRRDYGGLVVSSRQAGAARHVAPTTIRRSSGASRDSRRTTSASSSAPRSRSASRRCSTQLRAADRAATSWRSLPAPAEATS